MTYVPMLQIPARSDVRRRPIETPRLWLFPLETSDAPELWTSVESCRAYLEPWLPWVPFQVEPASAVGYADASMSDWDHGRALRFAVRDRPGKRFLGIVSLEGVSHLNLAADLGYWLRQDENGRGLMSEAAGAAVSWAFQKLGAHRIRVAAATDNHRSLAVIRRLGFRFEGISRQAELIGGRWLDHAIFGRLTTD